MSLCVRKTRGNSDPGPVPIPINNESNQQVFSGRRNSLPKRFDMDYQGYLEGCKTAGVKPVEEPSSLMALRQIETLSQAKDAYHFTKYRRQFRDITPRETKFLEQFEEHLATFIADPLNREKEVAVQTLNMVFHSTIMLFKRSHFYFADSIRAVREFARMKYLVEYGDYMSAHLKYFQIEANAKSEGIDNLVGLIWTDAHKKLEEEKKALRRYHRGIQWTRPRQKMTDCIAAACDELCLNYDNIAYCIAFYSERNEACHNMVTEHIKRCDWPALAKQLVSDRAEMPAVYGEEEARNLNYALDRIEKRFFTKLWPRVEVTVFAEELSNKRLRDLLTKSTNRLLALEQSAKKEEEKKEETASLAQKRDQLESEKEDKQSARASKASTDSWTDETDDFGLGGFF
ncbi:MAG: hypothetical protein L6R36_003754 [Xanthoria steineri]|nr:MAG: hypothetical protein L6R36_003754 [Xanthoria steineri]